MKQQRQSIKINGFIFPKLTLSNPKGEVMQSLICRLHSLIVSSYQRIVNEAKLDISIFLQGIYFVKTLSDKGLSIGKFIKY